MTCRQKHLVFFLFNCGDVCVPEDLLLFCRRAFPRAVSSPVFTDLTRNAVHGADSADAAEREATIFFPSAGPPPPNTATCCACTCCVIKPHAIQNGESAARREYCIAVTMGTDDKDVVQISFLFFATGDLGAIINEITASRRFRIDAMLMCRVEQSNAEEFLEVGASPELVISVCFPQPRVLSKRKLRQRHKSALQPPTKTKYRPVEFLACRTRQQAGLAHRTAGQVHDPVQAEAKGRDAKNRVDTCAAGVHLGTDNIKLD